MVTINITIFQSAVRYARISAATEICGIFNFKFSSGILKKSGDRSTGQKKSDHRKKKGPITGLFLAGRCNRKMPKNVKNGVFIIFYCRHLLQLGMLQSHYNISPSITHHLCHLVLDFLQSRYHGHVRLSVILLILRTENQSILFGIRGNIYLPVTGVSMKHQGI